MEIPGLSSTYQAQATGSSGQKVLGKDEFLNLFITQLRYQNPLSPMDSTGFTAQLAQFGTLEQLTNIGKQMKDMLIYQNSLQNTLTTSLIGKTVKFSGNGLTLKGTATGSYSLGGDAASVRIVISDASGAVVRTINAGPQKAGTQSYLWDGKDSEGNALADGQYSVAVEALDGSGNPVPVTTLSGGVITGITYDQEVTYLIIDGGKRIQLGDITEINGGGA